MGHATAARGVAATVLAAGLLAAGAPVGLGRSASVPATGVVASTASCTQRTKPEFFPEPNYAVAAYQGSGLLRGLGYDGTGVLVAVVDSGVNADNPHFTRPGPPAVVPGRSFVPVVQVTEDAVHPAALSDPVEHGTAVAGLVAARPVEGSGVVGVAPGATVLPVQVYVRLPGEDKAYQAAYPNAPQLAAGIRYAADAGARVIAVALSQDAPDPVLEQAVGHARAAGALVVASAGDRAVSPNKQDSPRYPAAYPGVLSVTAVTASGLATEASVHGDHVGVAAPGEKLNTTFGRWGDCFVGDPPASSFAVGLVAGAAALVAQAHPAEGPELWKYRIEAGAVRPRSDRRDPQLGWGVLAPYDALTLTLDPDRPGPPLPGQPAAVLQTERLEARPMRAGPDPLDDARRLGVWLVGSAVAVALGLRLLRLLRRPVVRQS